MGKKKKQQSKRFRTILKRKLAIKKLKEISWKTVK